MGVRRTFKCSVCSYKFLGSGGPDQGFVATTRTFECTACKILFDGAVGTHHRVPKTMEIKFKKVAAKCPSCKSKDHLQLWDLLFDRHCPKKNCKGKLRIQKTAPLLFWD